jgi:MoxR-like ATPase
VTDDTVDRLREEVVQPLKGRFVGRDEVVDLIALAVVAGEHLFLYGPPGTAKSALIRSFAQGMRGRYFEYMLTRFSEPNEIFGPVDIVRLRQGVVATVTSGMLPEAEVVFLDELFNANSAVLNNLLTVLNERIYRRGAEIHKLPLLSAFSASNHLPEDETLQALFDRFLLRCRVDNLKREAMPRLLTAGWGLEQWQPAPGSVTADDLRALSRRIYDVDLGPVRELYENTAWKVRDLGIAFSDRRAVKVMKLMAASCLLCNRAVAQPSDLWVLRYVWDRAEQIAPLRALVQGVLEQHPADEAGHPLARTGAAVDGEELARELESIENQLASSPKSLAALARLREQTTDVADRAAWLLDEIARDHLMARTRRLLEQLGK